jgi:hypothetical protein
VKCGSSPVKTPTRNFDACAVEFGADFLAEFTGDLRPTPIYSAPRLPAALNKRFLLHLATSGVESSRLIRAVALAYGAVGA